MLVRFLLTALLITGLIPSSIAQEVPTPVNAKLVSDVISVRPGDTFSLGVLMEIDPGWHVYWKNPGDSGLPTKIEFEIPKAFDQRNINWPIPYSFKSPQGGVDFGYENSVLLWTNIEVPEDTKLNSGPRIEAAVSWISCKEICIPGKANLSYDIKLSKKTKLNNSKLFSKWNKLLPIDAEHNDNPFEIEVSSKKSAKHIYKVELELKSKSNQDNLNAVEYYPNPVEGFQIENLNYQKLPDDSVIKISFDVISDKSVSPSDTELDGLVVYTDTNGNRLGIDAKFDLSED